MGKMCFRCGELKPYSEFGKNKRSDDGLSGYCRACVKERKKDLRVSTPPERQRAYILKHRYGITVAQWDKMLIAQAGRCYLCEEPMVDPHVDHSHETNEVRGLLCLLCNTMLGRVEALGLPAVQAYLSPQQISITMEVIREN